MTKAYLGLVQGSCATHAHGQSASTVRNVESSTSSGASDTTDKMEVCDVYVSYDRDANGGEGPDCPMCKVHRLHGNYDKVFVMRVSISVVAGAAR